MEPKTEAFIGQRIKNNEQQQKKKITDWLGPHSQPCLKWESTELTWCVRTDWWIYYISGQSEHFQGNKRYLTFGLLTWHPGQEQLYLGLRKLFRHQYSLLSKIALKSNFYLIFSGMETYFTICYLLWVSARNWHRNLNSL